MTTGHNISFSESFRVKINRPNTAKNGSTEISAFIKLTSLILEITIFMNKKCAIKNETNPPIKNSSPENSNKTSPKKENSKAITYHFILLGKENTYKNSNEKMMSGLKI